MKSIDRFVYDRTLTYLQKNRDYGNSVDKTRLKLGKNADLVRMADKINRLNQLAILDEKAVVAESIEDTIMDLIVYIAIWKSGKERTSLEQCSSVARLVDLIENLELIATHLESELVELQGHLGTETLSDKLIKFMVNFILQA